LITRFGRALRWAGRSILRGLLFLLLMLVAFALIEGTSSLALLARRLSRRHERPLAERTHTRYDRDLGWANIPSTRIENLYGPGRTLTINSRGFRGAREVADAVAPGVTRIVCSGDSFTMGFGVGDDYTWCHVLETLAPGRETVNMGQGGYGVDQAYLWYRRDARPLAHQVHVFGFIREDFGRMLTGSFGGYGKPLLSLKDGALAVGNVPVPRRGYLVPWLTDNAHLFRGLRSVTLLGELFSGLRPAPERAEDPMPALPLTLAIIDDLARLNREKGSTLLVVLLPDMNGERPADPLCAQLGGELAKRGVHYFDLLAEMRKLPVDETKRFFIHQSDGPVPYLEGHYSEAGNRYVAEALDACLRTLSAP
jgi:hypothetical protein